MTSTLDQPRTAATGTDTLTMSVAEALIGFLAAQQLDGPDGPEPIFAGVTGILGHGNLAGIGEALRRSPELLPFVPARNEQGMVHMAAAYARASRRRRIWACTSSIGPGATNMVTAAAGATINRVPVLLLPGDNFATRRSDPVLQQLDLPQSAMAHVNETLRPVSRYFDVIQRPEQLWPALQRSMEVLTSPTDTGAVTLALAQDVQVEVGTFAAEMFAPQVWPSDVRAPDSTSIATLADAIRTSQRPLMVAGGGVHYADACETLEAFASAAGIPVAVTQAGMSSVRWEHPTYLGAIGATGTAAANTAAAETDLVIGVGTRWSDFTTASRTAFAMRPPMFSINVARPEAYRHGATPVLADARLALNAVGSALDGWTVPAGWSRTVASLQRNWQQTSTEFRTCISDSGRPTQAAVIAAVNEAVAGSGTVVCAAGSMPGDLHKLWRPARHGDYHVEYGYSCMGYEVAGALGVQLARPDEQAVALVGDGSWLMMHSELVTAIQEGVPLAVVLVDNGGYGSIGSLSASLGSEGFGTQLVRRSGSGQLDGDPISIDYVAAARALGATAVEAETPDEIRSALNSAWKTREPTVVVVRTDPDHSVPSFGSWWDVAVMPSPDGADGDDAFDLSTAMLARQDATP